MSGPLTKEHRANISRGVSLAIRLNPNRTRAKETKTRINKGRPLSEAHKKAIAKARQLYYKNRVVSEETKKKISESTTGSLMNPVIKLQRLGYTDEEIKKLTKNLEIMAFRSNTKYRQYDVIGEAKDNFEAIRPKFVEANKSVQNKLMTDYLYFGKVSLSRVVDKNTNVEVYQKNKLFLYPDIELAVYYLYSIKKLYPLMIDSSSIDYLEIEQLVTGFCGILEELTLINYVRAIRFPVPYK